MNNRKKQREREREEIRLVPNTCFRSVGSVPSTVLFDFLGVLELEWHNLNLNCGNIPLWRRSTL